jgi:predicted lipoprotein
MMVFYRIFLLFFLFLLSACSFIETFSFPKTEEAKPAPSAEYLLVQAILSDAIIPWHETFEKELQALSEQSDRFCIQPSTEQFARLKRQWRQAMYSWSNIGPVNFGPIDDTNVAWRFQFWPDPLNYVHRKFKSRLDGTNVAISAQELSEASVAIQGLSALEYLLFGDAQDDVSLYLGSLNRCKILTSTSRNLAAEGKKISTAWATSYKDNWTALDKIIKDKVIKNQLVQEQSLSKRHLEIIFNGMLTNLVMIKNRKVGGPLGIKEGGDSQDKASKNASRRIKSNYLESWRSETSLENIRTNLRAMEQLYIMPNGFAWYLTHQGVNSDLDLLIRQAFSKLNSQLEVIDSSAFDQLEKSEYSALDQLHKDVSELFRILRYDYMKALNLHYRFNSHDGD